MSSFRFAVTGAIAAFAIVFGGQQASAQQASGQFYGYASEQAPMPSGQDQYGGGRSPSRDVGCQVDICSPSHACYAEYPAPAEGESDVPERLRHRVGPSPVKPTCHVTIYRNHYVPIKVEQHPDACPAREHPGEVEGDPLPVRLPSRHVELPARPVGQPATGQPAGERLGRPNSPLAEVAPRPRPRLRPRPANAPRSAGSGWRSRASMASASSGRTASGSSTRPASVRPCRRGSRSTPAPTTAVERDRRPVDRFVSGLAIAPRPADERGPGPCLEGVTVSIRRRAVRMRITPRGGPRPLVTTAPPKTHPITLRTGRRPLTPDDRGVAGPHSRRVSIEAHD